MSGPDARLLRSMLRSLLDASSSGGSSSVHAEVSTAHQFATCLASAVPAAAAVRAGEAPSSLSESTTFVVSRTAPSGGWQVHPAMLLCRSRQHLLVVSRGKDSAALGVVRETQNDGKHAQINRGYKFHFIEPVLLGRCARFHDPS
jgi:hypothetical protein